MLDFPGGSDSKESSSNASDLGSIPGSGRSPEEGNGCPLQYSCLENSMDRGAQWATIFEAAESDMTEGISLGSHLLESYRPADLKKLFFGPVNLKQIAAVY